MATLKDVEYHKQGHVGIILMKDDSKRHALTPQRIKNILNAKRALSAQHARAFIIAAAGKVFCAGADLTSVTKRTSSILSDATSDGPAPRDLFEALICDKRPIIAAVNGAAIGGGFELTLCCDFVVAGPMASFMLPEVAYGFMPNMGLVRLAKFVGARRALEFVLTKRRLSASETYELGIVNRLCGQEDILDTAVAFAHTIVQDAPPAAIAAAKAAAYGMKKDEIAELRGYLHLLDPAEWEEGLSAFKEKRRANYDTFWVKAG